MRCLTAMSRVQLCAVMYSDPHAFGMHAVNVSTWCDLRIGNPTGALTIPTESTSSDNVDAQSPVFEMNFFTVNCSSLARFVSADNTTWTPFVSHQVGFRRRLVLVPPPSPPPPARTSSPLQCTAWTVTEWETAQMWQSLSPDALAREAASFAKVCRMLTGSVDGPCRCHLLVLAFCCTRRGLCYDPLFLTWDSCL